mgnify:CR=1 FL=1
MSDILDRPRLVTTGAEQVLEEVFHLMDVSNAAQHHIKLEIVPSDSPITGLHHQIGTAVFIVILKITSSVIAQPDPLHPIGMVASNVDLKLTE